MIPAVAGTIYSTKIVKGDEVTSNRGMVLDSGRIIVNLIACSVDSHVLPIALKLYKEPIDPKAESNALWTKIFDETSFREVMLEYKFV